MTTTKTPATIRILSSSEGDFLRAECSDGTRDISTEGLDLLLHDSDTAEELSPEELGCTLVEYVEAIAESLDCPQPEGHVRLRGRRVYAA